MLVCFIILVPLSEHEQDLSLHAPERKLLHHLLLMGQKPEDNDTEVRLQVSEHMHTIYCYFFEILI